jgi:hypothetical protein
MGFIPVYVGGIYVITMKGRLGLRLLKGYPLMIRFNFGGVCDLIVNM